MRGCRQNLIEEPELAKVLLQRLRMPINNDLSNKALSYFSIKEIKVIKIEISRQTSDRPIKNLGCSQVKARAIKIF